MNDADRNYYRLIKRVEDGRKYFENTNISTMEKEKHKNGYVKLQQKLKEARAESWENAKTYKLKE